MSDSEQKPAPKSGQKPQQQQSKKRRNKRKKGPRNASANKGPKTPLDKLSAAFVACGRCSFFFSGYWALVSKPAMEDVAALQEDGWLTLPYVEGMPLLIEKSFGLDLRSDTIRCEGMCNFCTRVFVYAIPFLEDGVLSDEQPTFQIQIKPELRVAPSLD